jgi:small-conductance mechanosensitive channel
LGLQKLAANYVSGFVILVERSVRIGDHVRVDGIEGNVSDIKTRYTLVRDAYGREVIIPNEMLLTQRVDNYSLSDAIVSLQTTVTVSIENSAVLVKQVLNEALGKVPSLTKEPPPQVFFTRFSPDGLEFTLLFWMIDTPQARLSVLSEVNDATWQALKAVQIGLPPLKTL